MFTNSFCNCPDGCDVFTFGELPTDPNCVTLPKSSEITLLIFLPEGATPPTDWTSKADWLNVLGQTGDNRARMLRVIGSLPAPEKYTERVIDGAELTFLKEYTLSAEIKSLPDLVYNFLARMQCGPRGYRLWYLDMADILYGGSTGIKVFKTDTDFVHEAGKASVTTANLQISWFTPGCDPARADMPGFLDGLDAIIINPIMLGGSGFGFGTATAGFGAA